MDTTTLILALTIFRYFLQHQKYDHEDIKTIGLACSYIASMYFEVVPYTLDTFTERIFEDEIGLYTFPQCTFFIFIVKKYNIYGHGDGILERNKYHKLPR